MVTTLKTNRAALKVAPDLCGRPARAVVWGLVFLAIVLTTGCSDEPEPAQQQPTGFSFFDLGANSILTPSVRKRLNEQLGSEATTQRGIVDLEATRDGLLQDHFAELHRLNQKLNDPPMERVEHDITRLTFRYARQKGLPFHFVELVFWNHDDSPLFFKISAKTDGPNIIDQLKENYGQPQTILWKTTEGRTVYWQEDNDVLMVSISPNRIGEPEYHIAIYFVANLERMVEREKNAAEQRSQALKRAGAKAF